MRTVSASDSRGCPICRGRGWVRTATGAPDACGTCARRAEAEPMVIAAPFPTRPEEAP